VRLHQGLPSKAHFFWTRPLRAAAEPRPDDPDNRRDDEIQVIRVPGVPKVGSPPMRVTEEDDDDLVPVS
jgi:hypothetical protein